MPKKCSYNAGRLGALVSFLQLLLRLRNPNLCVNIGTVAYSPSLCLPNTNRWNVPRNSRKETFHHSNCRLPFKTRHVMPSHSILHSISTVPVRWNRKRVVCSISKTNFSDETAIPVQDNVQLCFQNETRVSLDQSNTPLPSVNTTANNNTRVTVFEGGYWGESSFIATRNTVLLLTVIVAALSALDRVAMSVAILPMADQYGLTETAKGQISSVFSLGYGLGIIPAGIILSFVSPKVVMATGVTLWSLATLATPWAASYQSSTNTIIPLLVARTVMGFSESVVLPTVQKILFLWVPPQTNQTSITVASVFGGFQVGTIVAYALSPSIIDWWNDSWEGIFYVYGTLGFLWLLPWLLFVPQANGYNNGNRTMLLLNSNIGLGGTTSIGDVPSSDANLKFSNRATTIMNAPFKDMVTSRGVIAMTIAHAANNWGLYTNLAWSPTFYQEQYSLNVRDSAIFSILPSVAGAIGGVVAGTIADSLLKNGADRTAVRKLFQGLALFGAAACLSILTYIISSASSSSLTADIVASDYYNINKYNTPVMAQILLTCAVGLQSFNAAGYGASAQEKAGDKWAGLLYSVTSLPGVIMGSVAVYATGQILDLGLGWNCVFGLNVIVDIIGAASFIALYDSRKEFD